MERLVKDIFFFSHMYTIREDPDVNVGVYSSRESNQESLDQQSSIDGPRAASGPPASCLWPPNCYSFTMCFSWVSMCTPGLVSMPTIHRQLGHSLLRVQLLTFTFVFGAARVFTFWRL